MIASEGREEQARFLDDLSEGALLALPFLFDFWALEHQLPPQDRDWKTWVVLGGRGAGKTRAGAEWVRSEVEGARPRDAGRSRRVALVGETIEQTVSIMIEGESGILACSPPDRRPLWEAGRRRLVWPNGAEARVYSAHDPERLRGPQFDGAWLDEMAKWPHGEEAWNMLQFSLRLGENPRQVVTTTPRPVDVLRRVLEAPSTVMTHAPTDANAANLARSFIDEVHARYEGTRLGRQELGGFLENDVEGALWSRALIEASRLERPFELSRIVVAVDPPVTGHADSDACGIIVAGALTVGRPSNWQAVVLEDASVSGASPTEWAEAAVAAMKRHGADRLVAEVNQGGDLVETVIRQVDPLVPYHGVRALRGKSARAEPVAALYEQGKILHEAGLGALEDQMCRMTRLGYQGTGSPDRVDALVWAMHALMLDPAATWRNPRMRPLS